MMMGAFHRVAHLDQLGEGECLHGAAALGAEATLLRYDNTTLLRPARQSLTQHSGLHLAHQSVTLYEVYMPK